MTVKMIVKFKNVDKPHSLFTLQVFGNCFVTI